MITYRRLDANSAQNLVDCLKVFRDETVSIEKTTWFLQNDSNIVLAAFEEDKIVGYLLAYRLNRFDNHSDMLHIYHLFVLQAYQRQHIASSLMKCILEFAKNQSLHYVYLITQIDNDAANALYLGLGGHLHQRNKNVYYWYTTGKPKE